MVRQERHVYCLHSQQTRFHRIICQQVSLHGLGSPVWATFGTDWAILQRLGYIWDRWFDGHRLINDILVFDNYRSTIEIDEIFYDLELADTAGQVDYEKVRLVSNYVYATKEKNLAYI